MLTLDGLYKEGEYRASLHQLRQVPTKNPFDAAEGFLSSENTMMPATVQIVSNPFGHRHLADTVMASSNPFSEAADIVAFENQSWLS